MLLATAQILTFLCGVRERQKPRYPLHHHSSSAGAHPRGTTKAMVVCLDVNILQLAGGGDVKHRHGI